MNTNRYLVVDDDPTALAVVGRSSAAASPAPEMSAQSWFIGSSVAAPLAFDHWLP